VRPHPAGGSPSPTREPPGAATLASAGPIARVRACSPLGTGPDTGAKKLRRWALIDKGRLALVQHLSLVEHIC
jgi:hypothetical protein